MRSLLRFLVVSPFVVLREAPNHAFLTVPAGSIIESDHEPFLFGAKCKTWRRGVLGLHAGSSRVLHNSLIGTVFVWVILTRGLRRRCPFGKRA